MIPFWGTYWDTTTTGPYSHRWRHRSTIFINSTRELVEVGTLWPIGQQVSWNSCTVLAGALTPAISSVNETICKTGDTSSVFEIRRLNSPEKARDGFFKQAACFQWRRQILICFGLFGYYQMSFSSKSFFGHGGCKHSLHNVSIQYSYQTHFLWNEAYEIIQNTIETNKF